MTCQNERTRFMNDDAWQSVRDLGKIYLDARKEFKSVMDHNTKHLLLSELYCASSYLERLLFAIGQFSQMSLSPDYRRDEQSAKYQIQSFIESRILLEKFKDSIGRPDKELKLEELNGKSTQMLEALLAFNLNSSATAKTYVDYINMIYDISYEFHLRALSLGDLQIQLPRMNLIEMEIPDDQFFDEDDAKNANYSSYKEFMEPSEDDEVGENAHQEFENIDYVPKFSLKFDDVMAASKTSDVSVTSLKWRREKKYKEMIKKGHEAIFKKDHQKGLESFTRAINYNETAEALTLIAWAYSLIGNITEAKTYCLKAIRKDETYGPPYNDLGSYLLNEGNIEESLKWFELAKKCPNYQNREYPYINAGRAYMSSRQYEKALDEFSKALALAPYHEELHQTVEKLKKSLKTKPSSSTTDHLPL